MRLSGTKTGAINQYRGLGNQLWDLAGNRPSLDLPFADNKSLVDATTGANLVDFTRASSGTYVDSEGVIRTATTNLLLQSEDLTVSPWSTVGSVTVTADSSQGLPFTGASVYRIDYLNASTQISHPFTYLATNYTASVWMKGTAGETIRFSGQSGVQAENYTLTGEWQRLTQTWTATASAKTFNLNTSAGVTARTIYVAAPQLEQSTTVGEYIPTTSTINSAPRFDHDPTTGESLGLLVEESRTNSITNNMMVGAVAGTPGTNPTGWFLTGSANGISPEIVGTGVEDGITYVDIRYSGTSTNSGNFSILTSTVTAITAATGQSWTGSAYVKLQAGSLSNLTNTLQSVNGRSSVGAGLESTNSIYTPTSDSLGVQRRTVSITLANASTARISHTIFNAAYASGATIDITLRIGLPQLEQGAFATSVIPTSGTAATRAADVASISGSNFSSWYRQDEGTIFCEGAVPVGVDSSRALVSIDNDSNAERIQLRHNSTTARIQLVVDNNSTQFSASLAPNSFPPGEYRKLAMAMKVNDFAGVVDDAGTVSQNSSGTMPTPTQMQIGLGPSNAQPCKPIKRLTYWPARLPNETLQTMTQ
jgi:hypothetical protein